MTPAAAWRLLFVDDSATCRELLTALLRIHAPVWQVTTVDSLPAAIAELAQWRPDVILLDLNLGHDMHGTVLLDAMLAAAPGLCIVIVSGSVEEGSVIKPGNIGYVAKNLLVDDPPAFVAFLKQCWRAWHGLAQGA